LTGHGRRRLPRPVQLTWLALAVLGTIVWAGTPISQWSRLQTVCRHTCAQFQLNAGSAHALTTHGIPLSAYAIYTAAVLAITWMVWYGLAALIILRKPDDRGAVVGAHFFLVSALLGVTLWTTWAAASAGSVFVVSLFLFGLLFPDGRFRPGWTRWLAAGILIAGIYGNLPLPALPSALFLVFTIAVVVVQVYRFRSTSSRDQRQKVKWASLGVVAGILGFVALILPFGFGNFPHGSLYGAFTVTGFEVVLSCIPLSIGMAVLRSNLWDIDRVISRALSYTTLSLLLVGLYISGVIGFQRLFQTFAGHSSAIAIALSTLIIAALFGPLRHRVQAVIDRRFYRAKYDGSRTIAAFSQRLRDEVDLTQLSHDMTAVIRETLQPEHDSLWLRDPSDGDADTGLVVTPAKAT